MIISQNKINKILNFNGYFGLGDIEFGIHGPELVEGKIYISLYHYLQFNGKNPNDYDLINIGIIISSTTNEYKVCKYKEYFSLIRKYNFEFLENNEDIFNKYIKRITLHDAIKKVLESNGRKMSAIEIAEEINKSGLYIRKDKQLISSSQIFARISNYPNIFSKEDNNIFLTNYSLEDILQKELLELMKSIKNRLTHFYKPLHKNPLFYILGFIIKKQKIFEFDKLLEELDLEEFLLVLENELELVYQIYLKSTNKLKSIKTISDYLLLSSRLISEIPDFTMNRIKSIIKQNNLKSIDVVDYSTPVYLLEIFDNVNSIKEINHVCENSEAHILLKLILVCSDINIKLSNNNLNIKCQIGICNPPLGLKQNSNSKMLAGLKSIQDQTKRLLSPYYQFFIGVESILYSKGFDKEMRNFMLLEHTPSAIVKAPFNSNNIGLKALAHIEFGSSFEPKDIFVSDFTLNKDISVNEAIEIINERKEIENVSKRSSINEIIKNDNNWSPALLVFNNTQDNFPANTMKLKDVLISISRGKNIDRKKLYQGGEIKYIRTKDLDDNQTNFEIKESILSFDSDSDFNKNKFISKDSIIVSLIGRSLKANIYKCDDLAIPDQNLLILESNESILPDYLVFQLKNELVLKQINFLRKLGPGIPYISKTDLLSIKIFVPSIDEQRKILLSNFNEKNNEVSKNDSSNFIATLKHTLKQPLSTLSQDFIVLNQFLTGLIEEGKLNMDDILVPVFEDDDIQKLKSNTLGETLNRCKRMIEEAHHHLNKAEQLLKIENFTPTFKVVDIMQFLKEISSNYNKITFDFIGENELLNIDKYSFKVLLDNIIENAIKHGFKETSKPKIRFEIKVDKQKFDQDYICISCLNNGEPLTEEINTQNFVKQGKKSSTSSGDGYGGSLINKIIKLHQGEFEVEMNLKNYNSNFNVGFNIYLPKI